MIADDLTAVSTRLMEQADRRLDELGLQGDGPQLDFARMLARERAERAGRHLTAVAADRPYILGWLSLVEELAQAHLAEAQTVEEIEDGVLSSLDSVHSYLLAHELVGSGYLEEEYARCDQLFPQFSEQARLWEEALAARSPATHALVEGELPLGGSASRRGQAG